MREGLKPGEARDLGWLNYVDGLVRSAFRVRLRSENGTAKLARSAREAISLETVEAGLV